jgi:hypothetical protein
MSVRIIKDKKYRAVDCEQDGKGCIHNFTDVCFGCKIYTGHPDKPNMFKSS